MELIASGRDADVFAVDDSRVLRRGRDRTRSCEREAAAMEWVRGQGYPAPRVHSVDGPDMVLERVEGTTMVECLMAGTTSIDEAGRVLAELLHWLHSLEPPSGSDAEHAVRHLDLHPFNIIESPAGPVVIDWSNTDVGPGQVDTALTAVILAQAALVPADLVPAEVVPLILDLVEAFLRHAGPLASSDIEAAIHYRSRDPNLSPTEVAALSAVPALLHSRSSG